MALRFIETRDPFNLVTFECHEPYTNLTFRKPSVDTSINPYLVTPLCHGSTVCSQLVQALRTSTVTKFQLSAAKT